MDGVTQLGVSFTLDFKGTQCDGVHVSCSRSTFHFDDVES